MIEHQVWFKLRDGRTAEDAQTLKAGLLGLTKSLARTAAPLGIRVNAVAPGIVDTDMLRATHGDAGIADLKARVPLGELATPEDVAAAIVYLASDAASFTTGTVLVADGGYTLF